MCASQAAAHGLRVRVLEKGVKAGLKILVSGGGRCNFTNLYADPGEQFLSHNEHFCVSALRRFQPQDFIDLVEQHGVAYHEKKLGQLFCDDSAKDITRMLLSECAAGDVDIRLNQEVQAVSLCERGYVARTSSGDFRAPRLVLACGGLSLPKIASDLAFRTARDLSVDVVPTRAALVPLTWNSSDKPVFAGLSGIAVDSEVSCGGVSFRENLLFTHRGLSGPAILQASSYWREGEALSVNLLPDREAAQWLRDRREQAPRQLLSSLLREVLPNRVVATLAGLWFTDQQIGQVGDKALGALGENLNGWRFKPGGSEGYRTAEVTLGGIDTTEVSSKTFELNDYPGLYAIGEALDVTGWLGGFNFQWAWASGWCCARHLAETSA